jgi:acyl-CoA synthetase (AMP-forming)/AMP-acid ligase II
MAAPEPRSCDPISYLIANAARSPGRAAVIDPERTLSFAELLEAVQSAMVALQEQGIEAGDVVAVQLPNVWEYVALEIAIPVAGAVVMPLPLTLGEAELGATLDRSGARVVVHGAGPEHAALTRVASRLRVRALVAGQLCRARRDPLVRAAPADPERIVEIALTSGTTGLPKLASLSAGLKQATFEGFTSRLQITVDDRVLPMSPLMQGIGGMCLLCLRRGAALVMLREPRFSADHTLRVAADTRATCLVGVPTNVIRMLDSPLLDSVRLNSRVTAVAGAPMPADVAERWEKRTGSRVCIFYGSMDAGQLSVASPSDPPEERWHSVGRPHDSCEALICDPEGRALPPGEVGEICMRGPTVQQRYWGETAGPYAADGWAHMGDLGYLDEQGYLHVVGRLKDIVIRGGANINPYEVESALRRHPALADVCVVGRPDRELGERVVVFAVPRAGAAPTLDDLRSFLAGLGVARYKWPEFIELVEEIPLSGPGKVDRRALRERAAL